MAHIYRHGFPAYQDSSVQWPCRPSGQKVEAKSFSLGLAVSTNRLVKSWGKSMGPKMVEKPNKVGWWNQFKRLFFGTIRLWVLSHHFAFLESQLLADFVATARLQSRCGLEITVRSHAKEPSSSMHWRGGRHKALCQEFNAKTNWWPWLTHMLTILVTLFGISNFRYFKPKFSTFPAEGSWFRCNRLPRPFFHHDAWSRALGTAIATALRLPSSNDRTSLTGRPGISSETQDMFWNVHVNF